MSTKLLLLFLVLCVTQLQTSVHGQKIHITGQTGLKMEVGKPYSGIRESGRHIDEIPEYEREKGVLIRNERAAATPAPQGNGNTSSPKGTAPPRNGTHLLLIKKRVKGFVTVFGSLTGALIFLCLGNIGLFVWLSLTLKKLKKP